MGEAAMYDFRGPRNELNELKTEGESARGNERGRAGGGQEGGGEGPYEEYGGSYCRQSEKRRTGILSKAYLKNQESLPKEETGACCERQ